MAAVIAQAVVLLFLIGIERLEALRALLLIEPATRQNVAYQIIRIR